MSTANVQPSLVAQDWHHRYCFGCGPDNPRSLKGDFRFHVDSGEVLMEYSADDTCMGAPGYLHGGVIAALLDEAQGVLCHHIGHFVMTEKLQMSYSKAVALHEPFIIRAWLSAVRKRRLYTRALIVSKDGTECVRSRASWYLLPERLCQKMMGLHSEQAIAHYRSLMEVNRARAREIRQRLREQKKKESARNAIADQ